MKVDKQLHLILLPPLAEPKPDPITRECPKCHTLRKQSSKSCPACQRRRSAEVRRRCTQAGTCTSCKKRSAVEGQTICQTCKDYKKQPHVKERLYRNRRDWIARQKVKGICSQCGARPLTNGGHKVCASCRQRGQRYRQSVVEDVIQHYGGKCACCGEAAREFLTIDHIGGGGGVHRRSVRGHVYKAIQREGYPSTYRVLCMNCNFALGIHGHCPHEAIAATG